MKLRLVEGKLKKVNHKWQEYLKDKNLGLLDCLGQWRLIGIEGENGLNGLCEFAWELDQKETGYFTLEDFKEEVELGNDGFGLDYDEIEIIKEVFNVEVGGNRLT